MYKRITAKEKCFPVYYKIIDLIVDSKMERLEQESYTIYAALEKLLPTAIDKQNLDKSTLKLLEDNWTDEVNTSI